MKTLYLDEEANVEGRTDVPEWDDMYARYEAHAHDADGHDYLIRWEVTDEQLEREAQPDYDGDESDACDWDAYTVYRGCVDRVGTQDEYALVHPAN